MDSKLSNQLTVPGWTRRVWSGWINRNDLIQNHKGRLALVCNAEMEGLHWKPGHSHVHPLMLIRSNIKCSEGLNDSSTYEKEAKCFLGSVTWFLTHIQLKCMRIFIIESSTCEWVYMCTTFRAGNCPISRIMEW